MMIMRAAETSKRCKKVRYRNIKRKGVVVRTEFIDCPVVRANDKFCFNLELPSGRLSKVCIIPGEPEGDEYHITRFSGNTLSYHMI